MIERARVLDEPPMPHLSARNWVKETEDANFDDEKADFEGPVNTERDLIDKKPQEKKDET